MGVRFVWVQFVSAEKFVILVESLFFGSSIGLIKDYESYLTHCES